MSRRTYGPRQLRDALGLAEWQYDRARVAGIVPGPDLPGGKWSGDVVDELRGRQAAIRNSVGSVPDVGAERAAGYLAARLGIEVSLDALPELARQGLVLVMGYYKGQPAVLRSHDRDVHRPRGDRARQRDWRAGHGQYGNILRILERCDKAAADNARDGDNPGEHWFEVPDSIGTEGPWTWDGLDEDLYGHERLIRLYRQDEVTPQ